MKRFGFLLISVLVIALMGCCGTKECPVNTDGYGADSGDGYVGENGSQEGDFDVVERDAGLDETGNNGDEEFKCPDNDPSYVNAPAGCFQGTIEQGVRSFKGIPYAKPPVGDLRWKAPQPVEKIKGVYKAIKYGPMCVQFMNSGFGEEAGMGSEDCLYLNVWTPLKAKKLPVLVFVHGGGNAVGSSTESYYTGIHLAQKDAVVVSMNYRLGIFGFLAHPALTGESKHHSSGDYALLDIIQALRWVKQNIEAFGGDPDHVLLFGESAGAINTCCLVTSPLAKGLFSAALMESGSCLYIRQTQIDAEKTGKDIAERLGCENHKDVAACMRSKSVQDIIDATKDLFTDITKTPGPHVDGWVMPQPPDTAFSTGKFNKVPVLAGANKDDALAFIQTLKMDTPEKFRQYMTWWANQLSVKPDDLITLYDPNEYKDLKDAYAQFLTDLFFVCPQRKILTIVSKQGLPAFQYEFSYFFPGTAGPIHGAELFYVFGTFYRPTLPDAQDLSDAIQKYWINFAKSGNPNEDSLPSWPAFTEQSKAYMILDYPLKSGTNWRKKQCDFLDKTIAY